MHTYGLLALLAFVVLSGASSTERAPPGTSSLTFVFDTTGSMNDDLIQVQDGARKILDTVLTQREKLIYNYVYVPFHDPRVGPVYATTDSTAFQRHLNSVHVVGGGDCPEMTLSGIQLALETALPSSFIYVFTDARSKDYHLEDQILNLIQEKQSSVVFVMTGDCNDRAHPGFRTYEKIAAASFGQVFHLEKTDVNKVLNYVRHSVAARKVHVMYEVRDRGGTNLRLIPVDQHLTELTLSLSGDKDDGDFLDISLVDPKGKKVERTEFSKESGTIDLNNIKLIRIKQPMPGIWRVRTSSRLKHTLRVLGHGAIDFKYGFSARPVERIELTHQRPISHQSTYLLVNMTGLNPPGTVVEIALVDYYGKEIVSKPASIHQRNPFMYYIGPIVPPKGMFFVRVNGEDDKSYEFQRIAPTAISTVQAGGPRAYMADRTAALAGHSVNLTCSVASRSEYTLYWYKGTELLGGPLFYPYSDTAFWTLNEVTPQDRGEYKCVVVSDNGNHTASTFLETREPPPEITNIRNESSPVGMPTYLHCRTQSNRPTFQWSRANKVFGNTDNTRLYTNGTLMIVSTSRQDAGEYRCRVQTAGGTTEATLYLKVMELPRASIYPPSLFFVRGQSFNISCYATGDPKPEPQWYFKGNLIKPDHYKYYITYKYDLIVHSPMDSDAGVYECRASNMAGYHVDSAVVQMAILPKVKVSRNRQMVGRGDRVVLDCQIVVGTPKPKVIWYRGGREVPSYRYIQIDGSRLTIQYRGRCLSVSLSVGWERCDAGNVATLGTLRRWERCDAHPFFVWFSTRSARARATGNVATPIPSVCDFRIWKHMKEVLKLRRLLVPIRKAPPPPGPAIRTADLNAMWGDSASDALRNNPTPSQPNFTPPMIPSNVPQPQLFLTRNTSIRPKNAPPNIPLRPDADALSALYAEREGDVRYVVPPAEEQQAHTINRTESTTSRPDKPPPPHKPTRYNQVSGEQLHRNESSVSASSTKPAPPAKPTMLSAKPSVKSIAACFDPHSSQLSAKTRPSQR